MWPVSNSAVVRTSMRRMSSPWARRERSSTALTVVSTVGWSSWVQLAWFIWPGSVGEGDEGGGGDVEREGHERRGEPTHESAGVDAVGDAAAGEDTGEGG